MDSTKINGKYVHFGKYEWKIVEWNNNGCLLVCYVVDGREYFRNCWDATYRIDYGSDVSWPNCELHDWLNKDFLRDAFSDEEEACILNAACSVNSYKNNQVGIFLLERDELLKYTEIPVGNCWCLDFDPDGDEDGVLAKKYVQPAIWVDFCMTNSLIPGWKELTELLAFSKDADFGTPIPEIWHRKKSESYNLAAKQLIDLLEHASTDARKYYYEQIYETLYDFARHDDADSINKVFRLCPDLEPEGYYDYDQTLPLGEAIESNAFNAISALLENGCDIDYPTMAEHGTIDFAESCKNCSEKMLLFLIDKGATFDTNDMINTWVYCQNPKLAKQMIASVLATTGGSANPFYDGAVAFAEDSSIYYYGGLSDNEKNRFDEMLKYLRTLCSGATNGSS